MSDLQNEGPCNRYVGEGYCRETGKLLKESCHDKKCSGYQKPLGSGWQFHYPVKPERNLKDALKIMLVADFTPEHIEKLTHKHLEMLVGGYRIPKINNKQSKNAGYVDLLNFPL